MILFTINWKLIGEISDKAVDSSVKPKLTSWALGPEKKKQQTKKTCPPAMHEENCLLSRNAHVRSAHILKHSASNPAPYQYIIIIIIIIAHQHKAAGVKTKQNVKQWLLLLLLLYRR